MRHATFSFILFCQLLVVSGVSAQDDASDSSGREPLDPTMACLDRCSQTHMMCVSVATFLDCVNNEPACTSVRPRDAEIMAAFCEACGGTTVGCDSAPPMSTVPETGTAPYSSAPVVPALPTIPIVGTVPRTRARPPTAEEHERSEQERARGICNRQRGVWIPATVVLMPDNTFRLGVCRTPEGAELLHMIEQEQSDRASADEALGHRVDAESAARTAADASLNDRLAVNGDSDRARDSRIAALIGMVTCLQSNVARVPLARFNPRLQMQMRDSGLAENGYFICHGYRAPVAAPIPVPAPVRQRHTVVDHQETTGGGSGLHLRLQGFGHIGFTALHPTLVQMRGAGGSLPVGLGFDATVSGTLSGDWNIEGGAGLSYDWPDFQPFATNARVWYHAGLAVNVSPVVSFGFGYLGSDRFRPNLQSAYSFHGGYLELMAHFHLQMEDHELRSSNDVTDPAFVIGVRVGIGAAFRPAADTATDGNLQLSSGFEF